MSDEQKEAETLEAILRARFSDPRALVAALSISANRVLLTFGAVGDNRRVTLQVVGDEVAPPSHFAPAAEVASPDEPAPQAEPAVPEAADGAQPEQGEEKQEEEQASVAPSEPERRTSSRKKE